MKTAAVSLLSILVCSFVCAGPPDCDILATGSDRVVIFAPDFSVKWEAPAGNIHEAKLLENGNILFADEGVTEITPDKKIVFQYKAPEGQYGTCTCTRLPNGNTLIGENFSGKVKELAPDGSVAFEMLTKFVTDDLHHRMRYVRKLENGNYLVCHSGDHNVREYAPAAEIVWEYKTPNIAFCAERLKNGNTMISSLDQITEVDPKGEKVWEFRTSDLPELGIRNMTGFFLRENGNLVVGCYSAYDAEGKGAGMFEITREKKLVWSYGKPTDGRPVDRSMMGVEMLEKRRP